MITPETIVNPWLRVPTPLGELGMAGVLVGSPGTGFEQFRRFNMHALVLVVGGRGLYREEGGPETYLQPGDCIRVRPGLTHQYGPAPGGSWTEAFIAVQGGSFDAWYEPGLSGQVPLAIQTLGDPQAWFPRWLALVRSRPHSRAQAFETLLQVHQLYSDLAVAGAAAQRAESGQALEHSRRLLEAWPASSPPDWSALAAAAHCGYESWRKAFREAYGEPPGRFRRRLLMERAAELLRRTALTNEQLAEQFGCGDAFHFSKLFKSVHGHSPSEHRRRS